MMKTNQKILIGIGILVLVVLIGGWWILNILSQETVPPIIQENRVTVITDRTEYRKGEIITLIIANGLSEKLYGIPTIAGYGPLVEKMVNGKWGIADAYIDYDNSKNLADCLSGISPNSECKFEWDPPRTLSGIYRIKVQEIFSASGEQIAYSNEFTVK